MTTTAPLPAPSLRVRRNPTREEVEGSVSEEGPLPDLDDKRFWCRRGRRTCVGGRTRAILRLLLCVSLLLLLFRFQLPQQPDIESNQTLVSLEPIQDDSDYATKSPQDDYDYATVLSSLEKLTRSVKIDCQENLIYVDIGAAPKVWPVYYGTSEDRKIPRLIHQTAPSRCLTRLFFEATLTWRRLQSKYRPLYGMDNWHYYLHGDQAMRRLFIRASEDPEIQQLVQGAVGTSTAATSVTFLELVETCLLHGTARSDVWRYLVLWYYGGIYADLDTGLGPLFDDAETFLRPSDEAVFVVEQYHMASQYWMATMPRHPLMKEALQAALEQVWQVPDTGRLAASMITGPHALHTAYRRFSARANRTVEPAGTGYKPVWAGTFQGASEDGTVATVRMVGVAERQNDYIQRDVVGKLHKQVDYTLLNMTHFTQDKLHASGVSCQQALLRRRQNSQPD